MGEQKPALSLRSYQQPAGDAVFVDQAGDQAGLFESMDDQDRVIVLLNLLGREVRVRLPAEAIAVNG